MRVDLPGFSQPTAGDWLGLLGTAGTGTSQAALRACAAVQKLGGRAAYFDMDGSLSGSRAQAMDVEPSRLWWSTQREASVVLPMAQALLSSDAFALLVFDSWRSLHFGALPMQRALWALKRRTHRAGALCVWVCTTMHSAANKAMPGSRSHSAPGHSAPGQSPLKAPALLAPLLADTAVVQWRGSRGSRARGVRTGRGQPLETQNRGHFGAPPRQED